MNKKALDEFVLMHAQLAREELAKNPDKDFYQHALILDMKGGLHSLVFAGEPLHGHRMADTLFVYALSVGGADAFVIMADARGKLMSKDDPEVKRILEAQKRGEYLIAEDVTAPECLMVFGRSREHSAAAMMPYTRKAGQIIFDEPQARLADQWKFHTDMIPDIWERVH